LHSPAAVVVSVTTHRRKISTVLNVRWDPILCLSNLYRNKKINVGDLDIKLTATAGSQPHSQATFAAWE